MKNEKNEKSKNIKHTGRKKQTQKPQKGNAAKTNRTSVHLKGDNLLDVFEKNV